MKTKLLLFATWLLLASPLHAQLVADGATNTLANATNTITGTVTVGTNGAFTLLVLSDNVLVTNSVNGVIGANATARSNEVQLLSATARWQMSGSVFVGNNGGFNRLLVSNGASVLAAGSSTIGNGADFSGNANSNTVTVSGAGSLWSNGLELVVGELGAANRLEVNNGGRVLSGNAFVGRSLFSPSNTVVVTGAGSVWSNRTDLSVGGTGAGNLLVVSNGGWVVNSNAYLGNGLGVGNVALVTGVNSTWSNRADLYVGNGARGNQLVVIDGALVVDNSGVLGSTVTSSNNLALVTGSGSLWNSRANLLVGDGGSASQLVVSNGAVVSVGGVGVIGGSSGAMANTVIVDGPGTSWLMASNLYVGGNGSFNRLVITNGGMVTNDWLGLAGNNASSKSNEIAVVGSGSIWRNSFSAYVGLGGAGNRMTISDGGQVTGTYGAAGVNNSASNNLAVVTGSGSLWNNSRDLWVGSSASGNRLVVSSGGGAFSGQTGRLGVNSDSHNNTATITDPGSFWSYGDEMRVGRQGSGNILVVSNGAWVGGVDGSIGEFNIASNNLAVVTGTNSAWTNLFNFRVGSSGNGNRLVVENGGRIANDASFIGVIGSRNEAHLTGVGTVWNSAAELIIGDQSTNNLLVVSNGAVVLAEEGTVGNFFNASNNAAVVTGAGSTWSNAGTLYVGRFGSRNQLVVTNGGAVIAGTNLFLGESIITGSNRIVVDGGTLLVTNASSTGVLDIRRGTNVLNAGMIDLGQLRLTNTQGKFEFNGGLLITRGAAISNSSPFIIGGNGTAPAIWDVRAGVNNHVVAGELYVGDPFAFASSSFNQLFVTNGAWLTNYSNLNIGNGGNSNTATIAGPGSRYESGGVISVGGGAFNRLVVSNGGSLLGRGSANIGLLFSSTNNQIVITGPGSVWNQLGQVEFNGRGNQLLVTDGGLLACSNAVEGFFGSGTNLMLVAGPGSVLNCIETLGVGNGGRANQLQITNGALVTVGKSLVVGASNTSTNNRVLVDGGTLSVTNLAGTGLLDIRGGTNVFGAGLIETDILRMTNGILSKFEFNAGLLSVRSSRVSIGPPLIIGNGTSPATLHLAGNGTHDMTGTLGLIVTNNATLSGNGSLLVQLQVRPGATLSPGASVGKISLSTPPFFSGTIAMELAKNGAAVTNDQIQVTGTVTYGGALTVTNLGPTTLAPGDRFQLFNASAYAGSFSSLTLPPLPAPLGWTNKLLVDGSIEIIAPPAIAISSGNYTQSFDGLAMSGGGGAVLWRDNSTLLGWYAARGVAPTNITNYVASDGSGNAGALYSFGSTGSPERALGSIASDSVGTISYGLCLTNDTANSVSNFMITYTGEQWRNGSGVTNTLTFWYRVTPSALTNPEPGIVANWTQVTNLNFISPQTSVSATALDGNQATNRQTFSAALVSGLVVPPGQNVFLRWHDPNDSGADQGLAVDDLTVSFSAVISTRAFGVDVSHFQNESGIPQASWDQMFAEGKRFVFIKATEGLTGPHDPTMSNNVARASAAGLLAGVYHFAHPENRPTTNGAVLEASNLVVYAGSAIGQGRLRPVLDLEGSAATLSTVALTDWVIAFSDEIIARRGPGAAPIIYCSQTFANNELDSRLADYDLWLRTVGSGADVAFDDPPGQGFADATGVFNNWSFWQYSATGSSGGISPLDLDVCHNEYKPLTSYLIPAQPPTPINLTGITVTGGGAFQFSFTNTPGALFTVLATTNVSMPLSDWTVLGPITETAPGQFQFSDPQTTNNPQRYYRVQSP